MLDIFFAILMIVTIGAAGTGKIVAWSIVGVGLVTISYGAEWIIKYLKKERRRKRVAHLKGREV